MAKFAVILPAAGKSTRFSSNKRKKVFLDLKGRAVWLRAAELFANREDVIQTIIAVSPDDLDWFKEKFRPNLAFLNLEIVEGGAERGDTVEKALATVRPDADYVAIHDAARPLLSTIWVDELFAAAEKHLAVIPAVPISSTIKRVNSDNRITETVSRSGLWAAQTPQIFRQDILRDAFTKRQGLQHTDEAQLVEQLGHPVHVIEGWAMNLKITTAGDFRMAEALVDAVPKKKSFKGLHPFADEDPSAL